MAETHTRIANFARKNDELLAKLESTAHADEGIKTQEAYIADLEAELIKARKEMRVAHQQALIEKRKLEELHASHGMRLFYKMSGRKEKFQSMADTEEMRYNQAREKEESAKDRPGVLSSALSEAKALLQTHQGDSEQHRRTQRELDNLYDMLFSGPTPDCPEEDSAEWDYRQARDHHDLAEQRYRLLETVESNFSRIAQCFATATRELKGVPSTMDAAFSNSNRVERDILRRSAISAAESALVCIKTLILQIKQSDPELAPDFSVINPARGSIWADNVLDNILADYASSDRVRAWQDDLLRARKVFDKSFQDLKRRLAAQKDILKVEATHLGEAKQRLQDVRAQIFAQARNSRPEPPPYEK